jgi:hypothetical protein
MRTTTICPFSVVVLVLFVGAVVAQGVAVWRFLQHVKRVEADATSLRKATLGVASDRYPRLYRSQD